MPKEKAEWELHKNGTYCYEQILEVASVRAAAVRPPASHFANYSSKTNKTCRELLVRQRTAKSYLDKFYTVSGCSLENLPEAKKDRDK